MDSAGSSICGDGMSRLNTDEAICEIREDIGTLTGRVGAMESGISRIDESLRKLIETNALLTEIHRIVIAHDKRIGIIENRCHQREPDLVAVKKHLATDKPVEAVAAEWALRLVIFLGGALGWWLLQRSPKIWELLK